MKVGDLVTWGKRSYPLGMIFDTQIWYGDVPTYRVLWGNGDDSWLLSCDLRVVKKCP